MSTQWYILDEQKNLVPVEVEVWGEWRKTPEKSVIGRAYYCYGNEQFVWVASDFLGLDHRWGEGPPLVFETMLFDFPPEDNKCWRCTTWDESVAQHTQACLEVEAWLNENKFSFTVQAEEPVLYFERRKKEWEETMKRVCHYLHSTRCAD